MGRRGRRTVGSGGRRRTMGSRTVGRVEGEEKGGGGGEEPGGASGEIERESRS